jgi:ATP synthase I chain
VIYRGLRVEKNIFLTVVAVAASVGFGHSILAAIGVLLGGILAIVNYRWLQRGIAVMLDLAANTGEAPGVWRAGAKFFLRWVLIFLALAICQWYTLTMAIALIAGLLVSTIPIVLTHTHRGLGSEKTTG